MSRHHTSSPQSTIAINGPKIKELRNANSLTQLYISESLGVTVDTISRWENNRSPNIMVENAQKLAALLDVPIEEISNPGPEMSKENGASETTSIWTTWLLPAFLLLIFLTIVLYLIINPPRIIIELKDEGLIIKISSVIEKKDKIERAPRTTTEQAASPPHQSVAQGQSTMLSLGRFFSVTHFYLGSSTKSAPHERRASDWCPGKLGSDSRFIGTA